MATLKKAHDELYKRGPDEIFSSFSDLYVHCDRQRQHSDDLWKRPDEFTLRPDLTVRATNDDDEAQALRLNDWSFSQLCRMANVNKETINRLTPATASQAFAETLPRIGKPLQILRTDEMIRSVHGMAYTRLWNADLLDVVYEFGSDFTPPQKAMNDASTGLYCGEQDMFAFMIDPQGWIEINNQPFAPGFFVWNSEVGKRSLGIQTFWFQKICANHLVWDATEVVEFSRKHTANVRDGLDEIRSIMERLIMRRDSRRDSFATVIKKAMNEQLGDSEEVTKLLTARKLPQHLIKDAMELAREQGGFTIFAIVDALTKLTQKVSYAGDRAELDVKIGQLLALAA